MLRNGLGSFEASSDLKKWNIFTVLLCALSVGSMAFIQTFCLIGILPREFLKGIRQPTNICKNTLTTSSREGSIYCMPGMLQMEDTNGWMAQSEDIIVSTNKKCFFFFFLIYSYALNLWMGGVGSIHYIHQTTVALMQGYCLA